MKIAKGRDPLELDDGTVLQPGDRVLDTQIGGTGVFAGCYLARLGERIAMVRYFRWPDGSGPQTVYLCEAAARRVFRAA
jgi:hypothetical protein